MRPPNDDEPWPFPIASRPGERPHAPRHNTILVHHRRNEPRRRCQLGHHLAFTKNAQEPLSGQHGEVTSGQRAGKVSGWCALSAASPWRKRLRPVTHVHLGATSWRRNPESTYNIGKAKG